MSLSMSKYSHVSFTGMEGAQETAATNSVVCLQNIFDGANVEKSDDDINFEIS